jgi:hypothetical protein
MIRRWLLPLGAAMTGLLLLVTGVLVSGHVEVTQTFGGTYTSIRLVSTPVLSFLPVAIAAAFLGLVLLRYAVRLFRVGRRSQA